MKTNQLQIIAVADLPLLEISGLGQRRGRDGTRQLLAVGDEEFTIVVIEIGPEWGDLTCRRVRLEHLLQGEHASHGSQWEAADGDASGKVFVLQETPTKLFVINPGLDQLLATVNLPLGSIAQLAPATGHSANLQGEGLVLLKNGHVLVAKEKEPPVLIEFGPAGAPAQGASPRLLFSGFAPFPLPDPGVASFEPLRVWNLDSSARDVIKDISDIAVAPDGGLYALSDESRCIARLETDLKATEEQLSVSIAWELPREIHQPEGLVILDDMVPVVAIDRREPQRNLFFLSSLGG